MSYHAHQAQECFDDAKPHIDPSQDPVMWNIVNGLSHLAQAVRDLHAEVETVKNEVHHLRH